MFGTHETGEIHSVGQHFYGKRKELLFIASASNCLFSLVVFGFESQVERSGIRFFYEILYSSSELGFVPG